MTIYVVGNSACELDCPTCALSFLIALTGVVEPLCPSWTLWKLFARRIFGSAFGTCLFSGTVSKYTTTKINSSQHCLEEEKLVTALNTDFSTLHNLRRSIIFCFSSLVLLQFLKQQMLTNVLCRITMSRQFGFHAIVLLDLVLQTLKTESRCM